MRVRRQPGATGRRPRPDGCHHHCHLRAAALRRRPSGPRAVARARAQRRGSSRRHRHHAIESLRPAGPGVFRELADRRGRHRHGRARRSDRVHAVSELRGAASEARVLAGAHDARVLRLVGSIFRRAVAPGPDQRARATGPRSCRRHLLLQASRDEDVHHLRRGARPADAMERRHGRGAASATAPAQLSMRRVRRLRVRRVAPHGAEARGSGPAGARATRGGTDAVRHWRRRRGGRAARAS